MANAAQPRLRVAYDEKIRAELNEQFGYKNPMEVPKLDKIVINVGVGEAVSDKKKIEPHLRRNFAIHFCPLQISNDRCMKLAETFAKNGDVDLL